MAPPVTDGDVDRFIPLLERLIERAKSGPSPPVDGVYRPMFVVACRKQVYRFFGYDEHGGLSTKSMHPTDVEHQGVLDWLKSKPAYNTGEVFSQTRKPMLFIVCVRRNPDDTELTWDRDEPVSAAPDAVASVPDAVAETPVTPGVVEDLGLDAKPDEANGGTAEPAPEPPAPKASTAGFGPPKRKAPAPQSDIPFGN